MDNLFFIEDKIKERLLATVPEIKSIYLTDNFSDLFKPDSPKITPSVYVAYDSYTVTADAEKELQSQMIRQKWVVILVVSNMAASPLPTSKSGKIKAGELSRKIMENLLGWTPTGAHRMLRLAEPPKPVFGNDGVDYYPQAFSINIAINGGKP